MGQQTLCALVSWWLLCPYGDQGILVRRSVFEQLRGFKEMPLMEDLDLLLRLRKAGRIALIKLPITTSAM